MAIPTYDWTETEIRHLVERHHTPDERVIADSSGVTSQVICNFCQTSPWPCLIIEDLRAWFDENHRIRQIEQARRGKR